MRYHIVFFLSCFLLFQSCEESPQVSDESIRREASRLGSSGRFAVASERDFRSQCRDLAQSSASGGNSKKLYDTVQSWASSEPVKALEWIDDLEDRGLRERLLVLALKGIVDVDPVIAVDYVSEMTTSDFKNHCLLVVVGEWAKFDSFGVIDWIETHTKGINQLRIKSEISDVLIGRKDFQTVAALADSMAYGRDKNDVIGNLMERWVQDDAGNAMIWFRSLGGGERNAARSQFAGAWATVDPHAAFDFGLNIDGNSKKEFLDDVVKAWSVRDPHAALSMIAEFPDESRDGLVESLYRGWGETDPMSALSSIKKHQSASSEKALPYIMNQLGGKDPKAAADALMSIRDGEGKNRGIDILVMRWAHLNTYEAGEWVNQLPKGGERDQAAVSLAHAISEVDPGSAIEWAMTVDDPRLKNKWLRKLSKRWLKNDDSVEVKLLELGVSQDLLDDNK